MNAFFASVEQRDDPSLQNRPIAVCGDPDRRGVILAASYEARHFGVKTGQLVHEARALCPKIVICEGHWEKYMTASRAIYSHLTSFTAFLEMTSCDEAYLDMTEKGGENWDSAHQLAERIRDSLTVAVNLPCSVGVAPNKLLAKLASEMKKPRGVTVIPPDGVEGLLRDMPVEKLCGVGPKLKVQLNSIGIETCGQMAAAPYEKLFTIFGVRGHWLKKMGAGEDESPVSRIDAVSVAKSVGHATTFPANTADPEVVRGYLCHLTEKVGLRLRRSGQVGRVVTLTLRDESFNTLTRRKTLSQPVAHDGAIYATATQILKTFLPFKKPIRLVGVAVEKLEPSRPETFLWACFEKDQKVGNMVDLINERFGAGMITRARTLLAKNKGILTPPIPPQPVKWED